MKLYHLSSGPLRVNSYFLVNDDGQALVIDSGENYKLIKQTEEKYGFKIKAVLLTHGHFDHAGNAKKLQDDGAKIYVSKKDRILQPDAFQISEMAPVIMAGNDKIAGAGRTFVSAGSGLSIGAAPFAEHRELKAEGGYRQFADIPFSIDLYTRHLHPRMRKPDRSFLTRRL